MPLLSIPNYRTYSDVSLTTTSTQVPISFKVFNNVYSLSLPEVEQGSGTIPTNDVLLVGTATLQVGSIGVIPYPSGTVGSLDVFMPATTSPTITTLPAYLYEAGTIASLDLILATSGTPAITTFGAILYESGTIASLDLLLTSSSIAISTVTVSAYPSGTISTLDTVLPNQGTPLTAVVPVGGYTLIDTTPYYITTGVLLHFDGSPGSTAIVDEYGHTFTPNANTVLSTSTSKFGVTSLYSSGYSGLITSLSSDYIIGTQDFTVEFWHYRNTTNAGGRPGFSNSEIVHIGPNSSAGSLQFTYLNNSTTFGIWAQAGGDFSVSTSIPANTWTHIALSRSSGITYFFANGTLVGTVSDITGVTNIGSNGSIALQGYAGSSDYGTNGSYIDEFKFLNGRGLYSANFTPQTYQYTTPGTEYTKYAIATYLTGAYMSSNPLYGTTWTDISNTATGTLSNGATFGTTVNSSGTYGVVRLGNSNSQISFPASYNSPNSLFSSSTGNTTICYWVNLDSSTPNVTSILEDKYIIQLTGNTTAYTLDTLFYNNTTKKRLSSSLSYGTWYFVCIDTTNFKIYVNGVDQTLVNVTYSWALDANPSPTFGKTNYNSFIGKVADLVVYNRVLSASEIMQNYSATRYRFDGAYVDANYSSVVFLSGFEGSNGSLYFTEEKGHAVTTSSQAILSGTSKYGFTSLLASGTSARVSTTSADYVLGTGAFTIEFWHYRGNDTASGNVYQYSALLNYGPYSAGGIAFLYKNGTTDFGVMNQSITAFSASIPVAARTWVHIALVRTAGGVTTMYADGTSVGTVDITGSTNISGSTITILGSPAYTDASPSNMMIDELRITKGVARYTANFTVPTTPFPRQ